MRGRAKRVAFDNPPAFGNRLLVASYPVQDGSHPVRAMSQLDFSTPMAGFLRRPSAAKRREPDRISAAQLDKSTSVADGEGVGKSPMMRAFQGGSTLQPSSCARRRLARPGKPIKR